MLCASTFPAFAHTNEAANIETSLRRSAAGACCVAKEWYVQKRTPVLQEPADIISLITRQCLRKAPDRRVYCAIFQRTYHERGAHTRRPRRTQERTNSPTSSSNPDFNPIASERISKRMGRARSRDVQSSPDTVADETGTQHGVISA